VHEESVTVTGNLVVVRRSDTWDEHTVPAGLWRDHRLARGTWGLLRVVDGTLRFIASTEPATDVVLAAGDSQLIPPEVVHHLAPASDARFFIEFLRDRSSAAAESSRSGREMLVVEPTEGVAVTKIVAGADIAAGECGAEDITSENLEQMATTLTLGPPSDEDRRELVEILRWLASLVREMERSRPT
jgi:tellurite resistance-related uncharacterized protein